MPSPDGSGILAIPTLRDGEIKRTAGIASKKNENFATLKL